MVVLHSIWKDFFSLDSPRKLLSRKYHGSNIMGQMRSCVKALLKEKKKVKRHLLSWNENDLSLVKYVKKGFSFDLLICLFFFLLKVILRSFWYKAKFLAVYVYTVLLNNCEDLCNLIDWLRRKYIQKKVSKLNDTYFGLKCLKL